MPRHLDSTLVGFTDGGTQLRSADIGVRLDPGGTLAGPIGHKSSRLLRRGHHVHATTAGLAREIGSCQVNAGPRNPTEVDVVPKIDLGIRRAAPGRADCCDPGGEIEPWAGVGHLCSPAAGRSVKQVVVHAYQSGDHRVALQVHGSNPVGNPYLAGGPRFGNAPIPDDDALVGPGSSSGSVD